MNYFGTRDASATLGMTFRDQRNKKIKTAPRPVVVDFPLSDTSNFIIRAGFKLVYVVATMAKPVFSVLFAYP
ncbi:hypothetical protein, partial [Hymenobacter rubidus]|uniref:hypothetical protein n=1 Tax=Hymenobacter rubidus TaxID=1441626 RepID=UPI001F1FE4A7